MDRKLSMSIPTKSPLYTPDLPIYALQTTPKIAFDPSPRGLSTRRGNSLSLSNRIDLTAKPLTVSTQNLKVSRHVKHNSLAIPTSDTKIKDHFNHQHPLLNGGASSPILTDLNYRKNMNTINAENYEALTQEQTGESFSGIPKDLSVKITDYSQPKQYEKRRNRSIAISPSHIDLSALRMDIPITTTSTTTNRKHVSQAYTNAMKALQDRIRLLEEKIREKENDKGMEELIEKHQAEVNEVAKIERTQRERAEMFERQNVELSLRNKALEEEKASLLKESQEILASKVVIEAKYEKLISDKSNFKDVYEDIEERVEMLQRKLEKSLKNEEIAQEKLNQLTQSTLEARQEKEMLREKNIALTEALQNLENEYSQKIQDLLSKNEDLEKEIRLTKENYGQQMQDFDQELIEIEKSHAQRIEKYENTIAELKRKIPETSSTLTFQDYTPKTLKNSAINTPDHSRIPRFSALSQQVRDMREIENVNEFDGDRGIDVSERKSYSRLSPLSLHTESGYVKSDYMPRVNLKVNTDFRGENANNVNRNSPRSLHTESAFAKNDIMSRVNFNTADFRNSVTKENNTNRNRNSPTRQQYSPEKTGRSDYSTHADKPNTYTEKYNNTRKSRNGYLNLTDLTNKETFSPKNHTNMQAVQVGARNSDKIDKGLESYLSPGNSNTSKRDPNFTGSFKNFIAVPKIDVLEPRDSIKSQKNLSFGTQEPAQDSRRGHRVHMRNASLNDASSLLIRKHRDDLMSSVRSTSRNLNNHASEVIEEKVSAREKELRRLNLEYEELVKKTQESQDPKQRSKLRASLIQITEDIQKINEAIYQLRKQGTALKV